MNALKNSFSSTGNRGMLITVLLTMIILSLTAVIFNLSDKTADRILILLFTVVLLIALILAYRGVLIVGQFVVPIVLLVMISNFVYRGGVRNPITFAFSAVILVAGLFLGEWGGTIFGILSAGVVLAVGLSEANGLLTTYLSQYTTSADVFVLALLVLGATLIQRVLVRQFHEVARVAQQNERAQGAAYLELRSLQADLEQRVSQRTAQLRTTSEVARVANSILDPDELINKVVNLITDTLGYYYAAIFIVVDNGRWAELKDATGSAGQILKARRHRLQLSGNSMVSEAVSTKEAQIASDVGETAVRFNNPLLPNTRSEIALPLIVGQDVIGAVDVQSTQEADFKPDDISTLQSLANQVAISIQNARLFQQMNDTLQELQHTNRQYVATSWKDKLRSAPMEYTAHQNFDQAPTLENKPIEVDLKLRDQKIGAIKLETGNEWTAEDQNWVESLATQVAISLENARLIEESQQVALRERLSSSIIQKIWSSNSIDSILQTAVRELGRALDASEAKIELKVNTDEEKSV